MPLLKGESKGNEWICQDFFRAVLQRFHMKFKNSLTFGKSFATFAAID